MDMKKIVKTKVTISFDIEADAAKLQSMSAEQLLNKKLSIPNIQFDNSIIIEKTKTKNIRYGLRWKNLVLRLGYSEHPQYFIDKFQFSSMGISKKWPHKSMPTNNRYIYTQLSFQIHRKTGDVYIWSIYPSIIWWLETLEMTPETKNLITNIANNLPFKIGYYNSETTLNDINYLVDMLNNGVLCLKKPQQK